MGKIFLHTLRRRPSPGPFIVYPLPELCWIIETSSLSLCCEVSVRKHAMLLCLSLRFLCLPVCLSVIFKAISAPLCTFLNIKSVNLYLLIELISVTHEVLSTFFIFYLFCMFACIRTIMQHWLRIDVGTNSHKCILFLASQPWLGSSCPLPPVTQCPSAWKHTPWLSSDQSSGAV